MTEFKVGDRVRVSNKNLPGYSGECGTVLTAWENVASVKLDKVNDVQGFFVCNLELCDGTSDIKEPKRFKVGDTVKVIRCTQGGLGLNGQIVDLKGDDKVEITLLDGIVIKSYHIDDLELLDTTTNTNPKTIAGSYKTPMSYIPAAVVANVNLALKSGADKYGVKNWLDKKVPVRTYIDAAHRHLGLWFEGGQECADDSGVHHLAHAIAGLCVIYDAMLHDMMIDDRPESSQVVVDLLGSDMIKHE